MIDPHLAVGYPLIMREPSGGTGVRDRMSSLRVEPVLEDERAVALDDLTIYLDV